MQMHNERRFAKIKELTDAGLSASEIGERVGISRNAVIGIWHRNRDVFGYRAGPTAPTRNKPPKTDWAAVARGEHPWPGEDTAEAFNTEQDKRAEAVRMRQAGYRIVEIAAALGISNASASRWTNPTAAEWAREKNREYMREYSAKKRAEARAGA